MLPDRVYKKLSGQKTVLMLISEKNIFSQNYIILAMLTLESKLLVLSSASFFSCSCCFDFSYPLVSAQVSLGGQINQSKASTEAIRNTNDEENFQL